MRRTLVRSFLFAGLLLGGLLVPATSLLAAQTSTNWSGYMAKGAKYTAVGGSWIVPTVTGSAESPVSAEAAWVGIGGWASKDLIQVGTNTMAQQNGETLYQAWYEILPAYAVPIPLVVRAGDSMSASITQTGSNIWQIQLKNDTTGENFEKTVSYTSSLSSAEWVEEVLTGGSGSYIPLADFGSMTFTKTWAVRNGTLVSGNKTGAKPLTLIDPRGQTLAEPGAIGSNGSFTVTQAITRPLTSSITVLPGKQIGIPEFSLPQFLAFHKQVTEAKKPTTAIFSMGQATFILKLA